MTSQHLHDVLMEYLGGGDSASGITVTPTKAMQIGTVYACVRILAESMAQLPRGLFTKNSSGKLFSRDDLSLNNVLKWEPNGFQDGYQFVEMATGHVALRGNHYSYINWVDDQVSELLPLHPDCVTVKRNRDWSLTYNVTMQDTGVPEQIPAGNIFHLRGISDNGYMGLSPVAAHRNGIGLSLATEKHGSQLFKNGARPGGVLRHPKTLNDTTAARILAGWNRAHGGDNSGGTAILEEGMEYSSVGMTNEDAQYLATRQFQLLEIARMFRVPAALLDLHEKAATYASAEQFFLSFVKFTMLPWVIRWEQAIRRQLLCRKHKEQGVYAKFNVSGMERADIKSRYEAYSKGIDKGILNPNECRAKEDMEPRDKGDEYTRQLNTEVSGTGSEKTVSKTMLYKAESSLQVRNRLVDKYRPAINSAAAKAVAAEVSAIRARIKQGAEGFGGWLQEYGETALPAKIKSCLAVVISGLASEIKAAALADTSADDIGADFLDFVNGYVDGMARRWSMSSLGQLQDIIGNAMELESMGLIEERIMEWEQTRAAKVANDEVVRVSNGAARYVWAAAGILKLVWKTQGSENCPFCNQMNGKVVGIQEAFIDRSASITATDGSNLKIFGKKMHPPIHQGCKCSIMPG